MKQNYHISLFILCFLILLAGCSDNKSTTYKDRAAAEAGLVFEQNILPKIIPDSIFNIKIESNQDPSSTAGEFYFATEDSEAFINQLKEFSEPQENELAFMGYLIRYYSEQDNVWAFLVNSEKGHCQFTMSIVEKTTP